MKMGILDAFKIGGPTAANSPGNKVSLTPKKILVVEDEELLRDFYEELLKGQGFNVLTAENGQTGLDRVIAEKPDLVLLDLMMPVMDGKAMLHKMREIPEFKKTPVIVLTNAGDSDTMHETKFYDNANEFLIKSNVTPDIIVTRIKSLIQ